MGQTVTEIALCCMKQVSVEEIFPMDSLNVVVLKRH